MHGQRTDQGGLGLGKLLINLAKGVAKVGSVRKRIAAAEEGHLCGYIHVTRIALIRHYERHAPILSIHIEHKLLQLQVLHTAVPSCPRSPSREAPRG